MEYKNKKEHKVQVLNDVNDADAFIIITPDKMALGGNEEMIIASIASALVTSEDINHVISEAIKRVMRYKKENSLTDKQ